MEEADRTLVVRVACLAARADASHRSEMVTQWLRGETLTLLEAGAEWARCRGPDGYEAWCSAGPLLEGSAVESWDRDATLVSLGCTVRVEPRGASERLPRRAWLPFGARAAPAPAGRFRLPDGTVAGPEDPGQVVDARERRLRFPATPSGVLETAERWLDAPYLWGGRTERGTDCSGMTQAIFALHGVALPRDSGPQSGAGAGVELPGDLGFRPADLLFFGEESRITHVALALGGSRILHAADANGAVAVDDLASDAPLSRRLRQRLRAVRRPLADPRAAAPTEGRFREPPERSSPPRSPPPPRRPHRG